MDKHIKPSDDGMKQTFAENLETAFDFTETDVPRTVAETVAKAFSGRLFIDKSVFNHFITRYRKERVNQVPEKVLKSMLKGQVFTAGRPNFTPDIPSIAVAVEHELRNESDEIREVFQKMALKTQAFMDEQKNGMTELIQQVVFDELSKMDDPENAQKTDDDYFDAIVEKLTVELTTRPISFWNDNVRYFGMPPHLPRIRRAPEEEDRVEARVDTRAHESSDKCCPDMNRGRYCDVRLQRPIDKPTRHTMLWAVIKDRTQSLSFRQYNDFIEQKLTTADDGETKIRPSFNGVDAYERLRDVTETFLLENAGILPTLFLSGKNEPPITPDELRKKYDTFIQSSLTESQSGAAAASELYPEIGYRASDGTAAGVLKSKLSYNAEDVAVAQQLFCESLDDGYYNANPYLNRVLDQFKLSPSQKNAREFNLHQPDIERTRRPLFMELIWSYWQEQGLLTQAVKAVSRRFQNKAWGKTDRLAMLEIDPLRPVNNLIWGYIQKESGMLTVTRRNYEYQHQYGLSLSGHAVGQHRAADVRLHFLESFHTLLHLCSEFYRQDDDRMVSADAYPVLNALKEVHLYLSKGAHNQYGDLAWTARTEMMMEQWILSHNALREFIPGRVMTAYPEKWQRQVDGMMSIMGWGDISSIHFNNLAIFGEQILLSVRYVPWVDINSQSEAKIWAQFWREEIQGYIHAYRAATGVDLSGNYRETTVNAMQPDTLIRNKRIQKPAMDRF